MSGGVSKQAVSVLITAPVSCEKEYVSDKVSPVLRVLQGIQQGGGDGQGEAQCLQQQQTTERREGKKKQNVLNDLELLKFKLHTKSQPIYMVCFLNLTCVVQ